MLSHASAGVDITTAQGTEGGGHTGDVGSMVLWPKVIHAVGDTPVHAAGGISNGRQVAAAMAMGAQGVSAGSLWLTVDEAAASEAQRATYHAAGSRDTVRSRSFTGKPARMLRDEWTGPGNTPTTPAARHAPADAGRQRVHAALRDGLGCRPGGRVQLVGQLVGQMDLGRSTRDVVIGMVEEFGDATERLQVLAGAPV